MNYDDSAGQFDVRLTCQKWVVWVAMLPGRGKLIWKFETLIWGFFGKSFISADGHDTSKSCDTAAIGPRFCPGGLSLNYLIIIYIF